MNKFDKVFGSQSTIGRVSRKITDAVGAKGLRESAGDYAGGRKVSKKKVVMGTLGLATSLTGVTGLAKMAGRKAAGKVVSKGSSLVKDASAAKEKRLGSLSARARQEHETMSRLSERAIKGNASERAGAKKSIEMYFKHKKY
jgi:hypothetical protein